MKTLATLFLTLSFISPAIADTSTEAIGTVHALNGKAWMLYQGKTTELKKGSKVYSKARIRTDEKTTATLLLKDAALNVKPGSDATIHQLRSQKGDFDWFIDLTRGAVLQAVKNAKKRPNYYRVRTRAAVLGVRGTIFYVKAKPEHDYLCTCVGAVNVATRDGKSNITLTSKHHDHPKIIKLGDGSIEQKLVDTPMDNEHTDPEAGALQALIE